jgi:hypothetical protein
MLREVVIGFPRADAGDRVLAIRDECDQRRARRRVPPKVDVGSELAPGYRDALIPPDEHCRIFVVAHAAEPDVNTVAS